MKQTISGIATPQSLLAVRLQRPFDPATETALVLTLRDQQNLLLRATKPDQLVLENISTRTIPFLVVILPKNALILRPDWKQQVFNLVQHLLAPPPGGTPGE